MTTIGLWVNLEKDPAVQAARRLLAWLAARQVDIRLLPHAALHLGCPERSAPDLSGCDCVLVLGGDGTLLAAARQLHRRQTPLLGVRFGDFGFLAEVEPEEAESALEQLLAGGFRIEERLMLQGTLTRQGAVVERFTALNDVVIAKGSLARMLHIRARAGAREMAAYAADGLIIATPTGSTAYSLSAGGPLVEPSVQALIVTPICPHSLSVRALLVPAETNLSIIVDIKPGGVAMVTVDGQVGIPLEPQDAIAISRSGRPARFVCLDRSPFYRKLQTRLRWGERN
ncbi:MAG: NAD(+)/NADH kinase [Armatimonadetes bacterium]|nr:NAD(+)/NADH kinase [Armatimonadota bacterium]